MATKQQLENRKIAAAGGQPIDKPTSSAALTDETTKRLLGSDIVSSEDTGLEEKFAEAKVATEEARASGEERILSGFERETTEFKKARGEIRGGIEARQRGVGFATTQARLEKFDEDTRAELKDLSDRKNEAIRIGDTQAASAIANLEISALQFNQKAKQQTFANMMSLAGLDIQKRTEERLGDQFKANQQFQKDQMQATEDRQMRDIQLEYGVSGDTFEEVMKNAQKVASKEKALELRKLEKDLEDTKTDINTAIQYDMMLDDFLFGDPERGIEPMSPLVAGDELFRYLRDDLGVKIKDSMLIQFQARAREKYDKRQLEIQLQDKNLKEQMFRESGVVMETIQQYNPLTGQLETREIPTYPDMEIFQTTVSGAPKGQQEQKRKLEFKTTADVGSFSGIFGE